MERKDYFWCYTKDMLNSKNISHGGAVIAAEEDVYYVLSRDNTVYTGEEAIDRGVMPSLLTLIKSNERVCVITEGEIYKKAIPYLKTDDYRIKVIDFSKPNISDGLNPLHVMKKILTSDPENGHKTLSKIIDKQASYLLENILENYTCFNLYKGLVLMFLAEVKEEELSFHGILNCLKEERYRPGYIQKISKYCKSDNYHAYFKDYLFADEKDQYEILSFLIEKMQNLCNNKLLIGNSDFEWDVMFLVTDEMDSMVFNYILSSYNEYLLHGKEMSYIVTESEKFLTHFSDKVYLDSYCLIAGRTKEWPIGNYLYTDIKVEPNKNKWNNALVNITVLTNKEGQFDPNEHTIPVHLDLYSQMFSVVSDGFSQIVSDYQIEVFDIKGFTDNLVELSKIDIKRNYDDYIIDPETEVEITDKNEAYDTYIVYVYGLNQYDYSLKPLFSSTLAKKEYIDDSLIPWKVTFTGDKRKDNALRLVENIERLTGKAFIQGCNNLEDDYCVS